MYVARSSSSFTACAADSSTVTSLSSSESSPRAPCGRGSAQHPCSPASQIPVVRRLGCADDVQNLGLIITRHTLRFFDFGAMLLLGLLRRLVVPLLRPRHDFFFLKTKNGSKNKNYSPSFCCRRALIERTFPWTLQSADDSPHHSGFSGQWIALWPSLPQWKHLIWEDPHGMRGQQLRGRRRGKTDGGESKVVT